MYIRRNIRWKIVFKFAWTYLLFYAAYGGAWVWLFHRLDHEGYNISMPFLPMSVIGIAVALYIGFKNSQAYDRFWEGRKIWGGIVNYSRTWTMQVLSFVTNKHATVKLSDDELKAIHKELVYRHIAWMNALRINLRRPNYFSIKKRGMVKSFHEKISEEDDWKNDVAFFLEGQECNRIESVANVPAQIVRRQAERLRQLTEKDGLIDDFRHMEMMRVLEEFYNLQGMCERIKNTPFPRQYAFFSKIFTWIYILILPLGLVGAFADMEHGYEWMAVPFYIVISWIFMTMEQVGDYSEDPFDGSINDVPMSALCRTIEIDLRQMLGETDLREKIQPVEDVLL
jgi:ion channel-forming bestrophin family protein